MKPTNTFTVISRRILLTTAAALPIMIGHSLLVSEPAQAQADSLPSWNEGVSKRTIVEFVAGSRDKAARISYRPPNASRCSTTMGPCGLSIRCTSKWRSFSIG